MSVRVLDHPLGSHLLTQLRDTKTQPEQFRRHAHTLGILLALEAARGLPVRQVPILTPMEPMESPELDGELAVVPILRAGLCMLEPFLFLFPRVAVGYLGLERDHDTARPSQYYAKLPELTDKTCFCLDPMLATGGSAAKAISVMKGSGAQSITMVSVVAAPEGIEKLQKEHPDVGIVTAAIDRELNKVKYILPGLGDFGDRLYAT
jgi:uracil phosphoribosyltransferase